MDEELKTIFSTVGLTSLAATCRIILTAERHTFSAFARGIVLAGFAGYLTALLIHDMEFSDAKQGGIIGIVAFCADDVLMGLLKISRSIKDNPQDILALIFKKK